MVCIGISYNSTSDLFYSGYNQTAILLSKVLQQLNYEVVLVNTKRSDESWWKECHDCNDIKKSNIYDVSGLDYYIDIDGLTSNNVRNKIATKTIVFMRTFLQFSELDNSVYPEKPYVPRYFEDVYQIWCWDIMNPLETIDSVQTLFKAPIKTVPFVWSSSVVESYANDRIPLYNTSNKWTVRIAEKNIDNTSSSIIPLVSVREINQNKSSINAKYVCHNMDKLKENRFFKENIYDTIEINKLPITFDSKQHYYEWLDTENTILLTHSRFVPIRIGLLNAIWLGLPVIHNSPIIKQINPILEKLYYNGNDITGISQCLEQFLLNPDTYYKARDEMRKSLTNLFGIDVHIDEWRELCRNTFNIPSVKTDRDTIKGNTLCDDRTQDYGTQDYGTQNYKITIGFTDMWPGFNYDSNFIIDCLRNEVKNDKIIVKGVKYSSHTESVNAILFGPYGEEWKSVSSDIPKIFFSAENWGVPNDKTIQLFLTSSKTEDDTHIRLPTWMTFIDWFSASKELPENCDDNPIRLPLHFAVTPHPISHDKRPDFCAFVVSNPICEVRNEVFKTVNAYRKVNSGGALYNTIGGQLSLKYPGGGCGDISKHKFFRSHKYTISFENSQSPGYITEKVLHSKMAGCIPLYWGDENTDTDFTPGSCVNLSNIKKPEEVVRMIEYLENNPEICSKINALPILDETRVKNALAIISNISKRILAICGYNSESQEHTYTIDGISNTYIINLDTRKDRMDSLLKEEPYLHKANRSPAVNGKSLVMNDFLYKLFRKNTFEWKKSMMGCCLSHFTIWTQLLKQERNYFLILEDDVRFRPEWKANINNYIKNIPVDADLLYLGGVLPPNMPFLSQVLEQVNTHWSTIKPNTLFSTIPMPIFHFCTYSYIITRSGINKVLAYLNTPDIETFGGIDHLLGSSAMNLTKYVATPLLTYCFQETDPSYMNSNFNDINRKDTFDSDIWNNTDCFTVDDLKPFF
jgi:GR25 family glycosyltransferase involved in LPS biosynthesis